MKTAKIMVALILSLLALFTALLIYRSATAEYTDSYYSPSIMMDGAYDWNEAMFSWNPALLPGYQLDTGNILCVGAVRVDVQTFKCVEPYQWYYEPSDGKYYFTAHLHLPMLCGRSSVILQPFLDVYNPTSGAHDRIWGSSVNVDYSWCDSIALPIIFKQYQSYGQDNLAYPAPQSQSQESATSKKSKPKGTPYP